MVGNRKRGGRAKETSRLPKEAHDAKVLSDSKLGRTDPTDPAGESSEQALSESKLGASDDGGLKGQGGMRDPRKTSGGKNPLKPT